MANTTQNRASVSAQFLRGAVSDLKRVERRVDDTAATIRTNALAQIEGVAEELERVATPDPDEVNNGE